VRVLGSEGHLTCLDTSAFWLGRAQKRIGTRQNVSFTTDDIRMKTLDAAWYDVVLVHFVLHDIEQQARADTARELARVLRAGGRLYMREPTKKHHGMRPEYIERLMHDTGLEKIAGRCSRPLFYGPVYTGVFQK
jgi:ubiquinone/menaquinone biosynthesis C-methylase UbiE